MYVFNFWEAQSQAAIESYHDPLRSQLQDLTCRSDPSDALIGGAAPWPRRPGLGRPVDIEETCGHRMDSVRLPFPGKKKDRTWGWS